MQRLTYRCIFLGCRLLLHLLRAVRLGLCLSLLGHGLLLRRSLLLDLGLFFLLGGWCLFSGGSSGLLRSRGFGLGLFLSSSFLWLLLFWLLSFGLVVLLLRGFRLLLSRLDILLGQFDRTSRTYESFSDDR